MFRRTRFFGVVSLVVLGLVTATTVGVLRLSRPAIAKPPKDVAAQTVRGRTFSSKQLNNGRPVKVHASVTMSDFSVRPDENGQVVVEGLAHIYESRPNMRYLWVVAVDGLNVDFKGRSVYHRFAFDATPSPDVHRLPFRDTLTLPNGKHKVHLSIYALGSKADNAALEKEETSKGYEMFYRETDIVVGQGLTQDASPDPGFPPPPFSPIPLCTADIDDSNAGMNPPSSVPDPNNPGYDMVAMQFWVAWECTQAINSAGCKFCVYAKVSTSTSGNPPGSTGDGPFSLNDIASCPSAELGCGEKEVSDFTTTFSNLAPGTFYQLQLNFVPNCDGTNYPIWGGVVLPEN